MKRTSKLRDIHRTPPHSVEAEQGVLGSMLISPRDVIGEVIERINVDYFYVPAHQTIYTVLVEIWSKGNAIDLITFTQELRDKKLMATIGGEGVCESLMSFVPTAANLGYYLAIVQDKYILRSIIASSTLNVRRAYEEQDEVEELLAEVERRALAIRPETRGDHDIPIKDDVMDAIEVIEKQYDQKGVISGVETGFMELDRMTSGLQPTEMIVIAARPSMGKTALAMNIAEHAAVVNKLSVGVFSIEMSRQQLTKRLICSRARVNLQKVRDGFISERDFPSISAAASKIAESTLRIDDQTSQLEIIVAKARRWKSEKDVRLIIIDYLQLIHVSGFKANERQQAVSHISASIKKLAKELKIPIIVIAQLNRQPEQRAGGKPRLSDLRESGSIEQDADLVALLTRPEVYEEDEEARAEKAGEAELIIAKQRNGPIGEIPLTFLKEFTRFEDRARNVTEPEEAF